MIDIDYVVKVLKELDKKNILGVKFSTIQLENDKVSIDVNLIIKVASEAQIESVEIKEKNTDMLSVRENYLKNKN